LQLSLAVDSISQVLFRPGTKNMCFLEKPCKPLTVDTDVIIKLADLPHFNVGGRNIFGDNQGIYISTKDFIDKLIYRIILNVSHQNLFKEGIELAILEPGKPWVTGKLRFNISYEFIPNEPEIPETMTKELSSPLDDIRKAISSK
jgi:hypothetical protein